MAIVPFEPRLSSRQDMTWPGTALDDAQAHGTIVERMARVLGVYRGPYTSAGGGAGEHYEEHPHEDDIDYQDEPEELYGGPDLISALPAGLKAGPTHFLLLGREMTNYIFLFFVFGSQSSISDTRAPARRLAWSSCTSRPQPLQRWRPLAGHGTPSASAQTACGMTRHAAARPSPPPAARGAVRRRAGPGGAKSALHRHRAPAAAAGGAMARLGAAWGGIDRVVLRDGGQGPHRVGAALLQGAGGVQQGVRHGHGGSLAAHRPPPPPRPAAGGPGLRPAAGAGLHDPPSPPPHHQVANSGGFRPRIFPIMTEDGYWDVLPGDKTGSPFPQIALCRAISKFEIRGSKILLPGVYLIRWRVRSSKGSSCSTLQARPWPRLASRSPRGSGSRVS